MAQRKTDDEEVNREFIPEQTSTKNAPAAAREFTKEFGDEMEFAANVDPAEEDLEKQRQAPQSGAAGITNRPLDEEEKEQEKLSPRNTRKKGAGQD